MIRSVLGSLFGPAVPVWALELTRNHAIVAGASADRKTIVHGAAIELSPQALVADVKERNIAAPDRVREAVERALSTAGFSGSEVVMVVPDDAARITLLTLDSLPVSEGECHAIIRWKLKKTLPFDVETGRVAFQVLGANGGRELLVALMRQTIVDEYESVVSSLGLHAGILTPSTPAALNLLGRPTGDVLLVKKNPQSVTTSVIMRGKLSFYRNVPLQDLYEAAYPTMMYYQDKLGGQGLTETVVCGGDLKGSEERDLGERLGTGVRTLHSSELSDVYKPALGALQV